MNSSSRRFLVLAATSAAALTLAACDAEVNVGDKTLSASEIEKESSASLTKQTGQEPAAISCPNDLTAKVGESEVCSLEDQQGGTYDMTVTVTSVDDDGNAKFDIEVGGLKDPDPGS